jgi:hypothetical protein
MKSPSQEKLDIVFDFDGVICEIPRPYDHFKYGIPNEKIIRLIKRLYYNGHILRLSTTRLCPTFRGKPDYDVMSGRVKRNLIKHLEELGVRHCFSEITGYKPYGDVYIDDRALWFNGDNHQSVEEIIKKIIRDKKPLSN